MLLCNFNRLYEALIWVRTEKWWDESQIIYTLKGTCKEGQSCIHIHLLLRESVLTALVTNRNVFVSYYGVSKAFDTVWVDGLF